MFWKFKKREPVAPDPNELVDLAAFSEHQRIEADMLKSRLDSSGVRSVVLEDNSMKMGFGMAVMGRVHVKVRYADLAKARRVLEIV